MNNMLYNGSHSSGYFVSATHLGGMASDRNVQMLKSDPGTCQAPGYPMYPVCPPSRQVDGKSLSATKGLRQFSLRVCKKVEERGVTTYNEVADELVLDMGGSGHRGDQKNIRRRVYDALNVLMAMDIIRKDKKEIVWQGLPRDAIYDLDGYKQEKDLLSERVLHKRKTFYELLMRHVAMKNLVERNRVHEAKLVEDAQKLGLPLQSVLPLASDVFHLPFIVISSSKHSQIKCEMLEDRSHYFFRFDSPFLIHGDLEILRMMGLCQTEHPALSEPETHPLDDSGHPGSCENDRWPVRQ